MPTTSARWPAEVARRDIFSSSQAPSVSSSRTSAISTLTVFARSSCAVTAFESASSVVTLAAVHDPPGRNSSPSPDGVAVSKGAVGKICILFDRNAYLLKRWDDTQIDLHQTEFGAPDAVDANQWR